jgi:hypothetical protein
MFIRKIRVRAKKRPTFTKFRHQNGSPHKEMQQQKREVDSFLSRSSQQWLLALGQGLLNGGKHSLKLYRIVVQETLSLVGFGVHKFALMSPQKKKNKKKKNSISHSNCENSRILTPTKTSKLPVVHLSFLGITSTASGNRSSMARRAASYFDPYPEYTKAIIYIHVSWSKSQNVSRTSSTTVLNSHDHCHFNLLSLFDIADLKNLEFLGTKNAIFMISLSGSKVTSKLQNKRQLKNHNIKSSLPMAQSNCVGKFRHPKSSSTKIRGLSV